MGSEKDEAEKASDPFNPFDMIDALDKSNDESQEKPTSATTGSQMISVDQDNDSNVPDIEEGRARVRNSNWPRAVRYDYSVYNVKPEDQDGSNERLGETPLPEPDDKPDWLHKAAKYEWDDEYGEIGPEVPELEEQLFHNKHIVRRGNDIKALDFEVKLEGPTPVRPVRQVS